MARQGDLIALALASAIIGGLLLVRRTDAAPLTPTNPLPPAPPVTPPVNPAEAQALAAARQLITTALGQAQNLQPEQRAALAQTLETTAAQLGPTSPQAAIELRAAAAQILAMNGTPIGDAPNAIVQQAGVLRQAAEAFLAGTGPMVPATLREMDRVAEVLARGGRPDLSATLVDLASRSYQKLGIQRPTDMRL